MLRILFETICGFSNFQKSNFVRGKFLINQSSINFPWSYVMSHTKFGPDRFSCFDVYWKQTNRHPDGQANYIWITAALCKDISSEDKIRK